MPQAFHDGSDGPLLIDTSVPSVPGSSCGHQQWRVLAVAVALSVTVNFGGYLSAAPQLKLLEDIVCDAYYAPIGLPSHDSHSDACKAAPVQGQVAQINGWKDTFDVLPSILLSVFYGALANRHGRRPMILLAVLGAVLGDLWVRILFMLPANSLSPRWIWASSVFRLLGGGEQVVISLIMIIVTDVFPEKERAGALFRLMAVGIFSEVVASPLSALLMTKDPWIPFFVGMALEIFGIAFILFLPETMPRTEESQETPGLNGGIEGIAAMVKRDLDKLRGPIDFLRDNHDMSFLLLAVMASAYGQNTGSLTIQFASLRLSWTYAQAVALMSVSGIVALVNTTVLLPALTSFMDNRLRLRTNVRDHSISQLSALLLASGLGLLSVATSSLSLTAAVLLMSLGSAYPIALRSLGAGLVDAEHVALFYSGVTAVESIGMLVSGPLFAALFELGLGLGGVWLGIPFLVAAAFVLVAFAAVSRVRMSAAVAIGAPNARAD